MRTAVSMLANYDHEANDLSPEANCRKAKRLLALIPTIIANLHRIRKSMPLISAS